MDLKVGCCGFPVAHEKYYRTFNVVELQSTFYRLPQEKTAIRWREEAPRNFEFAVKAWQAITHPPSSPTWRRTTAKPTGALHKYGLLKLTKQNIDAWGRTLRICALLDAKLCVIQTPPSFGPTTKNIRNMVAFFKEIDRSNVTLAWEPRGAWLENPKETEKACNKLQLVNCVDLLRRMPVHLSKLGYFRLHGLGRKQLNYSYRYTDEDHNLLAEKVEGLAAKGMTQAYVMFNNINMFDDARGFLAVVAGSAE